MHKNKPSKHKPMRTPKPRNPVVLTMLAKPKRNQGKFQNRLTLSKHYSDMENM